MRQVFTFFLCMIVSQGRKRWDARGCVMLKCHAVSVSVELS